MDNLAADISFLDDKSFRTRNKSKSYLAGLSDPEYLKVLNANIAAFAACATEVGLPFFTTQERTPCPPNEAMIKSLVMLCLSSLERHAIDLADFAKNKQESPDIAFGLSNAHDDALYVDEAGTLFTINNNDGQPRSLSGPLLPDAEGSASLEPLPYETSLPVSAVKGPTPDSRQMGDILLTAYRSVNGYKAGATIAETIKLNFG